MDSGFYSAFTGLAARMQSLDLLANNLANVNTTGYKTQNEFFQAFSASYGPHSGSPLSQAINDFGIVGGARLDMSSGQLQTTGNDTDLAIDGQGFFAVTTPEGPRYTRNGSFALNSTRQLVDSEGRTVQDTEGMPIQLPSGTVTIGTDGTISVDGAVATQLKVVSFPDGTQLQPDGNSDFEAPAGVQTTAATGQVRQGMVEASNADAVSSAVALIDLQRNAEMMQKALTIFNNDFNQTAATELPKI
jgi:flagellar basal-body rod protein FlgF